MECIVAIDYPLITAAGCPAPILAYKQLDGVMDILLELQAAKACLLFNEGIYLALSNIALIPEMFWNVLSKVKTMPYSKDADAAIVKVTPDVSMGWNAVIGMEIKNQTVALHKQQRVADTVYVIDSGRGFQNHNSLETQINNAARQHDLLNIIDTKDVKAYFDRFSPKLVQLKHGSQSYMLGGNKVSPFSAYVVNNTTYAEALLSRALDDYQGVCSHGTPPATLYTWDATNKCYVCFHHSGGWEYHGHDLQTPYNSVPDYIKKKYHIWK